MGTMTRRTVTQDEGFSRRSLCRAAADTSETWDLLVALWGRMDEGEEEEDGGGDNPHLVETHQGGKWRSFEV